MASESVHDKLSRVRKPHVHITYKVHDGDQEPLKELPFVVGVVGDFTGNPANPDPNDRLEDREFTAIDRDNFDLVMARMKPELNFRVDNLLQDDGSEIPVHLEFNGMEDFEPAKVAQQVAPLRELLEVREKLRRLQTKVDMDPDLENQIEELIKNTELKEKLGAARTSGSEAPSEGDNSGGDEA